MNMGLHSFRRVKPYITSIYQQLFFFSPDSNLQESLFAIN
jgi:hypothetical protein